MIQATEIVRSRQNKIVKWAASLADKKGREESGCFMAEGIKLTLDAARAMAPVTHLLLLEGQGEQYLPRLEQAFSAPMYANTLVTVLSEEAFSKISTEKSPQGVISIIKHLDFSNKKDIIYKVDFCFSETQRILALCSVRDPSNLGAVIRSAAAFGVDTLVLSADCADVYHPKALRASMGSLFFVKLVVVGDLPDFIGKAKAAGRRVFTAELSPAAAALDTLSLRGTDIFVIGNEGHGVDAATSAAAGEAVYIPITDKAESLNASVAAALLMWEQSKL